MAASFRNDVNRCVRRSADRSVYYSNVPWEWLERIQSRLLSNHARGTLM